MMNIAIIGAMDEEIALLKEKIKNCTVTKKAQCEFYCGQLSGVNVTLVKSGIGKVAAALSTTLLLEYYPCDVVINMGSAGGLSPQLTVGDLVISSAVGYHDVDLTAFGYKLGQMSGCPELFIADKHFIHLALACAKQQNINAVTGLICSGDTFMNGDNALIQLKVHFPDAIAVDMEAAAIAQVCFRYNTSFLIARAISDVANKESAIDFNQFLPVAAEQSSKFVQLMLNKLSKS